MLTKKVYIPIGVCLVLLLAIGFLALRSDVPDEPIIIYKETTPIKRSAVSTKPQTVSASMSIERVEETPVSTSEVDVSELDRAVDVSDIEVSLSDILSQYPDYETMDAWNQANVRRWVRKDKILAELRAGNAELERKLAVQEAQKELLSYLESTRNRLKTEYPDVTAFRKQYPDPQIEDFIREYPNENERSVFFARALEAGRIYREMADRILATPGMTEFLSSRSLETVYGIPSIDEMSEAMVLLRRQGVSE